MEGMGDGDSDAAISEDAMRSQQLWSLGRWLTRLRAGVIITCRIDATFLGV